MVNNQLKNIKKEGWARRKNTFEKKDLCQVLPGLPGHRSTRFDYFFALASLLPYMDRSSHQLTCWAGSSLITMLLSTIYTLRITLISGSLIISCKFISLSCTIKK